MIQMLQIRPVPLLGQRNNYKPLPYRPVTPSGAALGQTGAVAALGALPLLLGAAIGGGIAWAGFSMASKNKGVAQVVGYIIGSLGALGALGGTLGAILWATGVYVAQDAINASEKGFVESVERARAQSQPMTEPSLPGVEPFETPFSP